MDHAGDDEDFARLLGKFANEHKRRTRGIDAHMKRAKEIIETKLRTDMNVQHTPITTRLKGKTETLATLSRRQKERKQLEGLRKAVIARGEPWEQYCKEWRMADKANEVGPFRDIDEMFEAMHDLAGVRISLYFPNDVQKVVEFLRRDFTIVQGPSRKGGIARDFQNVRKIMEQQRQKDFSSDEDDSLAYGSASIGYRATHMVVRIKDLSFDSHAADEPEVNIEIQIGTIVMHAWSDIEHDILYKPSETGEVTADMVSMLGIINSIVTLGEDALRQLESVATSQATRQAEDRTKKAFNYHHMVTWLDKYFTDRKVPLLPKHEWRLMPHLFSILEATGEHTYGKVEELLDEMKPEPEEHLPALILQHLGEDTYPFTSPGSSIPDHLATSWNARYWATCVVNALSLAIYMNESSAVHATWWTESQKNEEQHKERPTLAEFLDILHPRKPSRRPNREEQMIQFCTRLLKAKFDAQGPGKAVLAALKLSSAGYIARPRLSQDIEDASIHWKDQPVVYVPSLLKGLTLDSDHYDLRMPLYTFGRDIPPKGDDRVYFVPQDTTDDTCAWKPVKQVSECDWTIRRKPFVIDESLTFKVDNLDTNLRLEHLGRVLEVNKVAEFRHSSNSEVITKVTEIAVLRGIQEEVDRVRQLLREACTAYSIGAKELFSWYRRQRYLATHANSVLLPTERKRPPKRPPVSSCKTLPVVHQE